MSLAGSGPLPERSEVSPVVQLMEIAGRRGKELRLRVELMTKVMSRMGGGKVDRAQLSPCKITMRW